MKSLTETVLEQSRSMNLESYSYSVLYTGFGSGGSPSSFGNAGQPLRIVEHDWGQMNIDRRTGDCLHIGHDGSAHIDMTPEHFPKLRIEKDNEDRYGNYLGDYIKGLGGSW